jgi:hypothetical protein
MPKKNQLLGQCRQQDKLVQRTAGIPFTTLACQAQITSSFSQLAKTYPDNKK